ncbi:MAG: ABC transporter ATP-binding protein/permease [Thermoflexales bacterium]|nr:ABC transporter ATP-binding protein/permease [Thermoflexales bacterium]
MRGGDPVSLQRMIEMPDERAKNRAATARRLLRYVAPYRREVMLVLLLVIVASATQALGPAIIGFAVDRFIRPGGSVGGLLLSMAALAAVYLVGLVAARLQIVYIGVVGQNVLLRLRQQIFEKVQRLPLRYFDKNPVGDVMSRLVNDTDTINQFLGQGVVQILGSLFGLVGILIGMFAQSVPLALASATVIPLVLLVTNVFSRAARRRYRKTRQTIGDVSANLQEEIAGVRVAQAYNRTAVNFQRFAERNAANREANMSANAVTSAFTPVIEVISVLAIALVAGFGGYLAVQGQASVGVVVAFIAYMQNLFRPLQAISTIYTQAQASLAGAERIFELLDTPDERDAPDARPMPPIRGEVVFDRVSFAYEPSKPVLREVSFAAQPGQMIAIVGPTGAGKTTLISLLQRFYDPTEGAIYVDGIDIRSVTRASLRGQMGAVLQDGFLFAGTVADNIRYGNPNATDEEVERAARLAGAHEFIVRMKDGYQTRLGERGGGLSQGQRQLISIARAILADPRILILDEATASVDTYTESLIQRALEQLMRGRTAFVIAHRLSTVRRADAILVLRDGRIVEQGTHAELLARGGLYAELYRRQFRDPPPVLRRADALAVPLRTNGAALEALSRN